MRYLRRAARVDDNQKDIVEKLRDIPGVDVDTNHNDILVGFRGKTFWFEIKNPNTLKKNGDIRKGAVKKSQVELREGWPGHYSIVWSIDQILTEIGVTK